MYARILPLALSIALTLALAGCSGERRSATPRFQPPKATAAVGKASGRPRQTRPALELPPPAHMFAGTRNSEGAIEAFCRRDRCRTEQAARPRTFLPAPASGFVVFTVHRAPARARLEVLRTGDDEAARQELSPGTTMLFPVRVSEGRYRIALVVSWRDSEARWLFGLKVE